MFKQKCRAAAHRSKYLIFKAQWLKREKPSRIQASEPKRTQESEANRFEVFDQALQVRKVFRCKIVSSQKIFQVEKNV